MAVGALGFPDILPLGHRTRTRWQALEVRTHINVPGRYFFGRSVAPNAGVLALGLRGAQARAQQQQGEDNVFKRVEHS